MKVPRTGERTNGDNSQFLTSGQSPPAVLDGGSLEDLVLKTKTLPSCLQETPGLVARLREQTTRRARKQRIGEDAVGPPEEGEVGGAPVQVGCRGVSQAAWEPGWQGQGTQRGSMPS